MGKLHRDQAGVPDLHMPFIASGSDPGSVGAHKVWLDTGSGTAWIRTAADDGWLYLAGSQPVRLDATDAHTLEAADHGYRLRLDDATGVTLTIPEDATDDLPVGFRVEIEQVGAGAVTITPEAGATLVSLDGDDETAGAGAIAVLLKVGADLWVASGDLITPES
jgi:hypothetical protein